MFSSLKEWTSDGWMSRSQDIILNERKKNKRKKVKLVIGGRDYKVAATGWTRLGDTLRKNPR